MALPILMPRFDPDETPGTVLAWHVAVGDEVAEGDPVADVECEKTVLELEAYAPGRVLAIVVAAGEAAYPHTILGILGTRGEPIDDLLAQAERERAAAPAPPHGNGKPRGG
ncbi:MAG: hypothetical protein HYU66_23000 [Armatimonadetes bacterium]|nr:hypothetical protein [Armatimonadota bacterium]